MSRHTSILIGIIAAIAVVAVVLGVVGFVAGLRNSQEGSEPVGRTVELYYYSPEMDTDEAGNILCSSAGLVPVERHLPTTNTPIEDTIQLLLMGEPTAEEEGRGITTEYPLPGLEFTGASLEGGVLTLVFADPGHATSGGSCRVGILWMQIRETALQFSEVDEVRFQPEELFQP